MFTRFTRRDFNSGFLIRFAKLPLDNDYIHTYPNGNVYRNKYSDSMPFKEQTLLGGGMTRFTGEDAIAVIDEFIIEHLSRKRACNIIKRAWKSHRVRIVVSNSPFNIDIASLIVSCFI
jgi:hypothetical protein